MKELKVKAFGPIKEATVEFGDLTILVGPQASGKSIFIQLLKLLIDKDPIRKTVEQYGYIWAKDKAKILDLYFGEGMSGIWREESEIKFDGKSYTKDFLIRGQGEKANTVEKLFYIPAQRILSIADGRPKTFMEFDNSAPFVLRQFSETLRQLIQNRMGKQDALFPVTKRLKKELRNSFNQSIFHDGKVVMDERSGQKKLRMEIAGMNVPFITWSAGQKEFMPLLLSFYWICPPSQASMREDLEFIVIEEPEMGLHPKAIQSVMLQVIDLLARGYQVVISTHSPVLLEFAWVMNRLKEHQIDSDRLFNLFEINRSKPLKEMFETMLSSKQIKTYFFDREKEKVIVRDISDLDAFSEDKGMEQWGGLSAFASRASDLVSTAAAHG